MTAVPMSIRAQAALELRRRQSTARRGGAGIDWSPVVMLPSERDGKRHVMQDAFIASPAKRVIIRAGRRGGKTVGVAKRAALRFMQGRRQLYAAPTQEQIDAFWVTIKGIFQPLIDRGALYKNETMHILEVPNTRQRIRAKTAWNADTLRGDYCDDLTLDEWQLMNEDAWGVVGAPMLADNNGDAVFVYTPPSLHSRSVSKAGDPQHAAKQFKRYAEEVAAGNARYATFHFTSYDNPFISREAVDELTQDMTALAYRMEMLAEDVNDAPGALWNHAMLDALRRVKAPGLDRVVIGVDPSATSTGDEAGIVGAGKAGNEFYVLEDVSVQGSPQTWAVAAVTLYHKLHADRIVAEKNNGGEMVELTIHTIDPNVPVSLVWASRNKQTRAEPIAALYEQGRAHHVGAFTALEDELCLWTPGDASPNRMDAMVWAGTELMLGRGIPDWGVASG